MTDMVLVLVVVVVVVLVLRFDCIAPVPADWLCSAEAEASLRYSTYDMLGMRATQNGVTFGQRNGGT